MDEKILKLKQQLLIDINNSQLPIAVLSMILHEISQAVDEKQQQIIKQLISNEYSRNKKGQCGDKGKKNIKKGGENSHGNKQKNCRKFH